MQLVRNKEIKCIKFSDSIKQVRISSSVIRTFKRYVQKEGMFESGGILFGYVYSDYDYIVKVTVPNKFDLRGFTCFTRSKFPAQVQINKSWKKSRGFLIYLGEWHTHGEINPTPSTIDIKMIEKTFKETEMEINFLYLIIVGLKDTYWIGRQTSNGLRKLDDSDRYLTKNIS